MSLIDKISMFRQLSDQEKRKLLSQVHLGVYQKGRVIVPRNSRLEHVFFVLSGRVVESAYTQSGKEAVFNAMSQGGCFGLQSILGGNLSHADTIASTNCETLAVDVRDFYQLMKQNEQVYNAVFCELAKIISSLSDRLYKIRAMDVSQRTRAELLKYAAPSRYKNDRRFAMLSNLPTHEEIANTIFSHREAVTKEITKLRKKGIIFDLRKGVPFANIQRLSEYLEV